MIRSGTLILSVAARLLMPLQLLFSLFLLLRGHDAPGGGFIAGLVAAGAFALYLFAHGIRATRTLLRVSPRDLVGLGLMLAVVATLPGALLGQPLFTAQWWTVPGLGVTLSTPLLFDIGVYLVVLGALLTAVMALVDAGQGAGQPSAQAPRDEAGEVGRPAEEDSPWNH